MMSLDGSQSDIDATGESSTAQALRDSNKQGGTPKEKAPLKQKSGPDMDQSIAKVVSTLESRVTEFGKASKDIRTLAEAVRTLTQEVNDLKRKRSDSQSAEETGPSKRGRLKDDDIDSDQDTDNEPRIENDPVTEDVSDDELEGYLKEDKQEGTTNEEFEELEEFFEPLGGVGEEVGEKLGKITDKALRGNKEKKDDEKLGDIKQKHLRPKNIPNLQVPKVDDILWRQLKREVRAVDFQLQKASANYSQALIPVIKAMEFMKKNEHEKASECITDTFKTLCLHIKGNIAGRRERIRKELEPKFRPLCQQEASATNLFGDNFQEAVKKLEGVKSNLTSSSKTF